MSQVIVEINSSAEHDNDGFTTVVRKSRARNSGSVSNLSNNSPNRLNQHNGKSSYSNRGNTTKSYANNLRGNSHSASYGTSSNSTYKKKPYKKNMDLSIKEMFVANPCIESLDEATSNVCDDLFNNGWDRESIKTSKSHIEMGITCRSTAFYNVKVMREGLDKMTKLGNKTDWDKKKGLSIFHPLLFPRLDIVSLDMTKTISMIQECMNSYAGSTILTVNNKQERPLAAIFISDAYTPEGKNHIYSAMTDIPQALASTLFMQACNKLTKDTFSSQLPIFAWVMITHPLTCIKLFLKNIQSMKKRPSITDPQLNIHLVTLAIFRALSEDIDDTEYTLNAFFEANVERKKSISDELLINLYKIIQEEIVEINIKYQADLEKANDDRDIIEDLNMFYNETMQLIGNLIGELANHRGSEGITLVINFMKEFLTKTANDIEIMQFLRAFAQAVYCPIKDEQQARDKEKTNDEFITECEKHGIIKGLIILSQNKSQSFSAKVRFDILNILEKLYGKSKVNALIQENQNASIQKHPSATASQNTPNIADIKSQKSVRTKNVNVGETMKNLVVNYKKLSKDDIEQCVEEIIYCFQRLNSSVNNLQDNIIKGFDEFIFALCEHGDRNYSIISAFGTAFLEMDKLKIFPLHELHKLITMFMQQPDYDSDECFLSIHDVIVDCPHAKDSIEKFIHIIWPGSPILNNEELSDYPITKNSCDKSDSQSIGDSQSISSSQSIQNDVQSLPDELIECNDAQSYASTDSTLVTNNQEHSATQLATHPAEQYASYHTSQQQQNEYMYYNVPGPFRVAGYSPYYGTVLENCVTGEHLYWNSANGYWFPQSMWEMECGSNYVNQTPHQSSHQVSPQNIDNTTSQKNFTHRGKRGGNRGHKK